MSRRTPGVALLFAALVAAGLTSPALPSAAAGVAAAAPFEFRVTSLTLNIVLPPAPPPSGSAPGLAAPYRLAAGDFFGEGRDALAVLHRAPGGQGHLLRVYREAAVRGAGGPPAAVVEVPDLLADGLVAADVTGNGRDEIWLGHSPGFGCLEWDGEAFRPLKPWGFWQNKPVAVARLAGPAGLPDQILALGAYYSPDVGIGLIAGWWRDRMWGKAYDVRPDEFFCPADRLAAADLTGDGSPELVIAASRLRTLLPVVPLTIAGLTVEKTVASFPGLVPDAIAAADLDGDGTAELYAAENLPAAAGEAGAARVRGFIWDGQGFVEAYRQELREPVADLTVGDLDGDGRPALLLGLVRTDQDGLGISLVALGKGEAGW